MSEQIQENDRRLNGEIGKLNEKIDQVEVKLTERMDRVEYRLGKKIDKLDEKVGIRLLELLETKADVSLLNKIKFIL